MEERISVRFRSEGKQYDFDPRGLRCLPGDGLIVETANGLEYAKCSRGNSLLDPARNRSALRPVIRKATEEDLAVVARNREKEKYAFRVCQEKIAEHGLDMKLVSVECGFEGNKILFFFTSEGRVDFRGLVKSLAGIFHTRIELRQIGIRDEAKLLGGLGICGRPFCCTSFLREFQPVSIKMAKTQNLSLNPTKISGTCGRLMCCLKYEQAAYEDLMKDAPRMDSFVETPDGAGTIISVNTLREKVRVRLDNEPDTLRTYLNSEIRVIRSGKGKRPEGYVEPPLEELAKLRKETESPEEQLLREQAALAAALDSFLAEQESEAAREHEAGRNAARRRRSGGNRSAAAAEQNRQPNSQEKEARQDQPKKEGGGRRRSHRGHRGGGKSGQSEETRQAAPQPAAQSKQSAPKTKAGDTGEKKAPNRRWYHHRGHRRSGGGNKQTGAGEP